MARQFGNLETQKLFDKTHGAAKAPAEEKAPKFGEEPEENQDEHEGVVEEHGKAHTIHIKHDHEAQHSHVHSIHESGHEHHADFHGEKHHHEAHAHAKKMAGAPEHEDEAADKLNEAGHGEAGGGYEKASALGIGSMSE